MQTKITKEQARQVAELQGALRAAARGVKQAKAKAGTPKFLVRFAVNSARRQAVAEVLRDNGLPTGGPVWREAKSVAKIS